MKNILLCPPTYYKIAYEINPWMKKDAIIDYENISSTYQTIKELYQKLGATVYEIQPNQELPDMVYTANVGHVHNEMFIKSNFRYDERKDEAQFAADYFAKKFGFKTVTMPNDVYFEGQGDLLKFYGNYYLGYGKRTSKEAKKYLEEVLLQKIYDFEMINPYYYHLDTCFAVIAKNTAVINPKSFTKEGLGQMKQLFTNIIEVSDEDNNLLACNLVTINTNIIIGQGISDELKKEFDRHGFTVHEMDMTEYLKGGGSVKCITFEF